MSKSEYEKSIQESKFSQDMERLEDLPAVPEKGFKGMKPDDLASHMQALRNWQGQCFMIVKDLQERLKSLSFVVSNQATMIEANNDAIGHLINDNHTHSEE